MLADRVRRPHLLGHHQAVGRDRRRRRRWGVGAEVRCLELVDVDIRHRLGTVTPHTAVELLHAIDALQLWLPKEAGDAARVDSAYLHAEVGGRAAGSPRRKQG